MNALWRASWSSMNDSTSPLVTSPTSAGRPAALRNAANRSAVATYASMVFVDRFLDLRERANEAIRPSNS